jgi:hypothetical protein
MAYTGVMPAVDLVAPRYGLEAGATVVKHGENEQTWGAGFMQENGLCGIVGETWVWCGAQAEKSGNPTNLDITPETTLTGSEGTSTDRWEQVYPFLVQAEDTCMNTLHAKRPETKKHLLDVLEFLSIKGAERELWVGGSSVDAKALTRNATMVGTNLSPKVALAVVEEGMAKCLPGVQGTLHLTPAMAALLENSLHEDDGKLTTFSGSRVIVGAGYAGQSPGDATHSAIYGTGPVIAHLGPTSMITDELAQMANVKRNEFAIRAERLVAVTFDGCCHVGATVSLT